MAFIAPGIVSFAPCRVTERTATVKRSVSLKPLKRNESCRHRTIQPHIFCSADYHAASSRRSFVSTALVGVALGVLAPPRASRADTLQDVLVPILDARQRLDKIPGLSDEERWDPIRTILKSEPLKSLESYMAKGANLSEDPVEAFEEMDIVLAALNDADNNIYLLAVQFPNKENQKRFTSQALKFHSKAIEHFDAYLSFFPEDAKQGALKKL